MNLEASLIAYYCMKCGHKKEVELVGKNNIRD